MGVARAKRGSSNADTMLTWRFVTLSAGALALVIALLPIAAAAQENRANARDVVKKWQDAVVNVRVVLKTRISIGGREMQSSDDSVDTVGTVIDPSGLTVMSLGSLNPGAMMNRLMSAGGGSGSERTEFASEPTDLKLRLPGGRPGGPPRSAGRRGGCELLPSGPGGRW